MGKSSKHKKFRKIADELPEIKVWGAVPEIVKGKELIEQGIEKLKTGIDILPEKTYTRKVPVPINHERMLKRVYDQSGNKGVTDYVAEVYQLHERQKQEIEIASYDGQNKQDANN